MTLQLGNLSAKSIAHSPNVELVFEEQPQDSEESRRTCACAKINCILKIFGKGGIIKPAIQTNGHHMMARGGQYLVSYKNLKSRGHGNATTGC